MPFASMKDYELFNPLNIEMQQFINEVKLKRGASGATPAECL